MYNDIIITSYIICIMYNDIIITSSYIICIMYNDIIITSSYVICITYRRDMQMLTKAAIETYTAISVSSIADWRVDVMVACFVVVF